MLDQRPRFPLVIHACQDRPKAYIIPDDRVIMARDMLQQPVGGASTLFGLLGNIYKD